MALSCFAGIFTKLRSSSVYFSAVTLIVSIFVEGCNVKLIFRLLFSAKGLCIVLYPIKEIRKIALSSFNFKL